MLSESTLGSRSINQGYKLLASVRITITNLLQKDFSETQLSIKKTNDQINKGSLNTIKDNKNRSYSLTYSRFIYALNKSGIKIDRKILAEIAYDNPEAFKSIVKKAQAALK